MQNESNRILTKESGIWRTEYSLVGYTPRAISGHKMSKVVNVKLYRPIFSKSRPQLFVIDNGMSNNNKANQITKH